MNIIKGKLYFIKIKRWKYPQIQKEFIGLGVKILNLDEGKHVGLALANVPDDGISSGSETSWHSIPFLINKDLVRVVVPNNLRFEYVFDGPLG